MRTGAFVVATAFLIITHAALAQDKGKDKAKDKGKPAKDGTVVLGAPGKDLDQVVGEVKGFWGSVVVAAQGKIILAKGYGFADYKEVPNTPLTLHEIASASKQVTATAILRLEQDGKLKTSDPIARFFPTIPADKKKITVKQLLNHTSGISKEAGLPYASEVDRDGALAVWLKDPLDSPPGEKFAYSNVGYALLAAIVEVASGASFDDYAKTKLFAPAGLTDTGFIKDAALDGSRASTRKSPSAPGALATAHDWFWGWGYRGMGGVVTTVLDLAKWDRALRTEKLLKKKSLEKLHETDKENYACGWNVEQTARKTTKAHHSGGVAGYRCQLARYLEDDVFIAVLSNDENDPVTLEKKLSEIVFAK